MPGITLAQCRIKWRNVKHNFFKYERNRMTNGSDSCAKPQAYELMRSFININPFLPAPGEQHPFLPTSGEQKTSPGKAESKGKVKNGVDSSVASDHGCDELPTTSAERTDKKRRLASSACSERANCLHAEILEEVRRSGRKIEALMAEANAHQRIVIDNQKKLLQIERRRNELLEEKLRLGRKRK